MTLPGGAELGSTDDPKALIKGEPSAVAAAVRTLGDEARKARAGRGDAQGVSMGEWSGGYGQPAWQGNQREIVTMWTAYGTLLDTASTAAEGYGEALRTAQDRAQDAIDKWNEGERATERAQAAHEKAVDSYLARARRTVPTYGPMPSGPGPGAPPGPFVDPGAALRAEAERILKEARKDLDDAGVNAIKQIAGMIGPQTDGSTGGDLKGKVQGPKFSWEGWSQAFGSEKDKPEQSPFKLDLVKIDGSASAWGARGSFEDYLGGVRVKGDGSVDVLQAKGSGSASISGDGVEVKAGAKVLVVGADGKLTADIGPAEAGASGSLEVGAGGDGTLSIDGSGIDTEAEVFAGFKAKIGANLEVGGVGVEGELEGQAGFGGSFDFDAGVDDGKLEVDAGAGLAFILGARVKGGVTIDPGKVVDSVEGLFE